MKIFYFHWNFQSH